MKIKIEKIFKFKFELEKLSGTLRLESPLDSKEIIPVNPKGYQSRIFIGRTDAEAETPILFTTWCAELTHWKRPLFWQRLNRRRRRQERMRWLGGITNSMNMSLSKLGRWTGKPGVYVVHGIAKSQTQMKDWTELKFFRKWVKCFSSFCPNKFSHAEMD